MSPQAACHNHPDRPALAICVQCRSSICGECTTKLQGINHCTDCLERRAHLSRPAASPGGGFVRVLTGITLSFFFFWLVFHGATLLALHLSI